MLNISSPGMSSRLPGWTSWGTPSPSTDATPSWTAPRPAPRYPLSQDMRMCPQSIWLPRVSTPERPSPRSRSCWQALLTRESLASRWIHRQQQKQEIHSHLLTSESKLRISHTWKTGLTFWKPHLIFWKPHLILHLLQGREGVTRAASD